MGRDIFQQIHFENNKGGISFGVLKSTPKQIIHHQTPKKQGEGQRVNEILRGAPATKGDNQGTKGRERAGFLLPHIRSSENFRKDQTHPQPQASKFIHNLQKVQNGVHIFSKGPSAPKLLYGLPRPKGRIPAHPDTAGVSKISKVCDRDGKRNQASSISGSTLRPLLIAQNFYQDSGRSSGTITGQRHICHSLFGRPSPICRVAPEVTRKPQLHTDVLRKSGLAGKFGKIQFTTQSANSILGVCHRFSATKTVSAQRKDRENSEGSKLITSQYTVCHKADNVNTGTVDICDSSGPMGRPAFSATAGVPVKNVGSQAGVLRHQGSFISKGERNLMVVEDNREHKQGTAVESTHFPNPNHRRKWRRVGSAFKRSDSARDLGKRREEEIIQLEGIKSSMVCTSSLPVRVQGSTFTGQVRQCVSDRLYKQTGRNKERSPVDISRGNLEVGRKKPTLFVSNPLERGFKQSGRFPQQEKGERRRLGAKPGGIRADSSQVGNTSGGLVCLKGKQESQSILLPGKRGRSARGRCAGTSMGIQKMLCLSPTYSPTSGNKKTTYGEYNANSHSALLAQETVVLYAQRTRGRTPLVFTDPGRSTLPGPSTLPPSGKMELGCMVSEEQLLEAKGFSGRLIDTMLKSRKMETRNIYQKVWRCFNRWCIDKKFNTRGSVAVLEFLQDGIDKGLSLSTLKSQVSALSVYLEKRLASDPWVIRLFRSLSRQRPIQGTVFPKWDLSLVLQTMTAHPFEPLDDCNLKMLTFKAVFLVAITTAKRVCEMEALSIRPPFFQIFPDHIIFRMDPAFLPKVASKFHRGQEIVLPSFCPNPSKEQEVKFHSLDVRRCVLHYLEATKDIRKTDSLFILISGARKGQKATRRTIARWLKEAIEQAYRLGGMQVPEGIRAHSTRAMAASQAERAGATPEQICKAATWSSFATFVRHYRVDLWAAKDQTFGRKVLQAVVPP
ncbi:uncharacterized protein [Aquarana catesbeiana]|uniref:uncharacterized protein n=2 Tax=Aquarana catesbeiana TaxID=8400 RepID=UPI003CCA2318